MRRPSATVRDYALNGLAVLLLVASLGFAAQVVYSKSGSRSSGRAVEVKELVGRSIDSLKVVEADARAGKSISTRGAPAILYVFSTTCPACNHQKEHVTRLFNSLPRSQFFSISTEDRQLTGSYWPASLPPPLQVTAASVRALGVSGVPTVMVVDRDGVVREAQMGLIMHWTPADLIDHLNDND